MRYDGMRLDEYYAFNVYFLFMLSRTLHYHLQQQLSASLHAKSASDQCLDLFVAKDTPSFI